MLHAVAKCNKYDTLFKNQALRGRTGLVGHNSLQSVIKMGQNLNIDNGL